MVLLRNTLLLIVATFVFWSAAFSFGRYAEVNFDASARARLNQKTAEDLITAANAKLKSEGNSVPALLELAGAELQLAEELEAAKREGSGGAMIEALKAFEAVLKIDPQEKTALLSIARLSLGVGVADKARDYFKRYLEIEPGDVRVTAEYALALSQSGASDEAIRVLEKVNQPEANFYATLALAFTYETIGKLPEAANHAKEALALAAGDEQQQIAAALGRRLAQEMGTADSENQTVEEFLRAHPIIGPKIVGAKTDDGNKSLIVTLEDFPIEQMPEFAKKGIIQKIQAKLDATQAPKKVVLLDSKTRAPLLEVSATK